MRTIILTIAFIFLLTNVFAQATESNLQINRLTGDFYIYTTCNLYQGNKIPANGMYLVTSKGVVLFDAPWDTTQFQPLLDSIKLKHDKTVVLCIPTHFHDDRTAGLAYYRQQGIKTYTTVLTDELSKKNNKKRAEFLIAKDTVFSMGEYLFETYYPGPGHTPDNIIIWFKKQKILYGACLIKSVEDDDLGYLGDANKIEYANTIKNVQKKCPQPNHVIVGHGDWTSVRSVEHTLMMAEVLKKSSKGKDGDSTGNTGDGQ
jgi:metallo-beta-lactamase class B